MSFVRGKFQAHSFSLICLSLGLALLTSCNSSGGSSTRAFSQSSCSSRQVECSQKFQAGEAEIELEALEAGQEYILVFLNLSPFYETNGRYSRIQINADWTSDPVSVDEERAQSKVLGERRHDLAQAEIIETIGLPANLFFPRLNLDTELYLPHFEDYDTVDLDTGVAKRLYLRSGDDVQLRGELRDFESLHRHHSHFDLLSESGLSTSKQNRALESVDCLKEVFEDMKEVLGPALDLDQDPAVNVAIATPANGNDQTIGWISQLDRFKTLNGELIPDSNYGENLYVSPRLTRNPSEICSTTAHELLHLIALDHKVLREIPEDRRADMQAIQDYGLRPEDLGLEEAAGQLIEELSGEKQNVYKKVAAFLNRMSGTSFSLEAISQNHLMNIRSRGLNHLLIYHALHLYGGRLDLSDSRTRSFIRDWILNPGTGLEHLASVVGMTPDQLLESFFSKLFRSLFDPSVMSQFVPEMVVDGATSRGFDFVGREMDPQEWALMDDAVFHPLGASLDQLRLSQSQALPPRGIAVYRMIVPDQREGVRQRLYVKMQDSDFQFFSIRVR